MKIYHKVDLNDSVCFEVLEESPNFYLVQSTNEKTFIVGIPKSQYGPKAEQWEDVTAYCKQHGMKGEAGQFLSVEGENNRPSERIAKLICGGRYRLVKEPVGNLTVFRIERKVSTEGSRP